MAIVKPHKQVSSCTIARWLKCTLGDAGIDVKMFTDHSVRGASSSAAAMEGVTTNDILKAADWSMDSVLGASITDQCTLQVLEMQCYLHENLSLIHSYMLGVFVARLAPCTYSNCAASCCY